MIDWWQAAPRRLAALVRAAWPKRGLVAEACVRLVAVETRLRLFPLKRQLRDLRPVSQPVCSEGSTPGSDVERQVAVDVGWAVQRTAAYLPFPALCLAQALAARAMLRRRGIGSIMYFGVALENGGSLEAHAWLEAAGVEVTGYPVPPQLREIGCLRSEGAGGR